jgi:hypothetical protein
VQRVRAVEPLLPAGVFMAALAAVRPDPTGLVLAATTLAAAGSSPSPPCTC